MKFHHYLLMGWTLMAGLTGCKPNLDPIGPITQPDTEQPGNTGTEVGQPLGESISQTIGPEGGNLTSADGAVKLILPAGALTKATTISIQSITNHAPNGLGLAYRFLPEGTQFAKPATLTFQYDQTIVANTDPRVFGVAFQGTDGRWYQQSGATTDTTVHQISVSMPHFSDWSAYELAKIESMLVDGGPAKGEYLDFGASTTLKVTSAMLKPLNQNSSEASLVINTVSWSVAGGAANGQIKGDGPNATYTAPGKYPPQNPVTVVAEITFKNSSFKVYLLKKILVGPDYLAGVFGGLVFNWKDVYYNRSTPVIHIVGFPEDELQSLTILFAPSNLAYPVGRYGYSKVVPQSGNSVAFVEFARSYGGYDAFLSVNYECSHGESPPPLISPGQVIITQVDYVDGVEYIKGRIGTVLYCQTGPCPAPMINETIEAEFRIKRTD